MDECGDIDYDKLDKLIEDQIAAGVAGVLACGTTAQSATLSLEEHVQLAKHIHSRVSGRCQYIASAGSNNTREALFLTEAIFDQIGPATFLHVTGYYNNPPQEGLIAHYESIAGLCADLESNVILYNVPGRTNSELEPETIIRLSEHEAIIGLKEARGADESAVVKTAEVIEGTNPEKFRVLSGEDDLVAWMMNPSSFKGGNHAYGVISATANVAPLLMKNICTAALRGEHDLAFEFQEYAHDIINAVFCAKNPIPLAHMFNTQLRKPLVRLDSIQDTCDEALSKYPVQDLGIDIAKYR
ncbi:4-hydroxy-tetrahydrodipicolinate synthase [Candidatus Woesearchaeota archaeon]|nr:MAG: 4-hydroxy-tetrahydrodipicolinate synthase [Candidatus Woesearchaeota archaeon]